MESYYSCPECQKTISGVIDTDNLWFPWIGAYAKEKCQYCKTKIKVNPFGLIVGFVLNISVLYSIIVLIARTNDKIPEALREALGVFSFAAILPFGIIIFCLLIPLILSIIGVRLYEKG